MAHKPNQAEADNNKGQRDAAEGKGYNPPVGCLKEIFFNDGPQRNADYDRGYRHVQSQKE